MKILFIVLLITGVLLFITSYKRYKNTQLIKKLSQSFQNNLSIFEIDKQKDTQLMLESSDKVLENIRKFDNNLSAKIIVFMILFFLMYFSVLMFFNDITKEKLAVFSILLLVAIIILPGFIYKILIDKKIRTISKSIPIFVDLLAVCVQSGMDIKAALEFLKNSTQNLNKNFAPFLNKLIIKSEISGLESALNDLQKELPSVEISMMCTTLKQSIKYGSSVYESLMSLSMQIRQMELLKTEEAIGQLSAKMSVPLILFFMFPVIVIIAAPGLMKILGGL